MLRIGRLLGLATVACALHAAVKLPALIADHMVLQQGMPVRIWGSADPGESVKVDFQGQSVTVKAAENGKWTAWLKPLVAAGPLEMTINNSTIKDVLVGEVWLGSGQSNMEFRLQTAVNHDEEIARADYPMIHLFQVKKLVADQPMEDVVGTWQVCSPASVKSFSAVEYFFGRHLQQNLHVPMGLIESDWGGTPAQSWLSKEAIANDPALKYRDGLLGEGAGRLSGGEGAVRHDDAGGVGTRRWKRPRPRAGRCRTGRDCRRVRGIRIRRPGCTTA